MRPSDSFHGADFFQVGGSLERDHPSYIERPADKELVDALEMGDLCMVLAPRQTGKSSLMVHALTKLEERGLCWAIVDLQSLGHHKDLKTWLGDVIYQIARSLKLSSDTLKWWQGHEQIGPTQRFMTFMEDVVLTEVKPKVVVFFDEIDSLLPLSFSDDFFTTLRALFNARASNPILKRITFTLLGVAIPSEFVKNRSRTPFNIGREIVLTDFNLADMASFKSILGPSSEPLVRRIFYWTGGQPWMVQALTAKVNALPEKERNPMHLDKIVAAAYLNTRIEKESHLNFIRDYLLEKRHHPQKLLKTYRSVRLGEPVKHDEGSLVHARLLLSGVVRLEKDHLKSRNRIYRSVFNEEWIKTNLPKDWIKIVAYLSTFALMLVLLWFFLIQPLFFPRFTKVQKHSWFDTDIYYVTQPDFNLFMTLPMDSPEKITLNGKPYKTEDSYEKSKDREIHFDFSRLKVGPNHFKIRFYGPLWRENFETDLTVVFYPASHWKTPVGLKMIPLPAGCFMMGCGPWTDECDDDEIPLHQVCLSAFKMGQFEVTQGQWQALMGHNPSRFKGDLRLPVESVSWKDVQVFLSRLNTVTGRKYRLPTEARWEYAARSGGRPEKYAGGDDLDRLGWYGLNSDGKTHPVGLKAPNGLGLYDMSGNVWEWCQDRYDDKYYQNSLATDPSGPIIGSARVFRGGSWFRNDRLCRTAIRNGGKPGTRYYTLGFRLALLPGQPSKTGRRQHGKVQPHKGP